MQNNTEKYCEGLEVVRLKKSIAKWKWASGVIALITAIITAFSTATVININLNTDKPLSTNAALVQAQEYFYSEKYPDALALYQEFYQESKVAAINLGYMYSKGLGCDRDFDLACKYYKHAYALGAKEGLENYLAINFLSPNDLETTLGALMYGVEEKHSSAIKYAAFLQSDELFAVSNEQVLQIAKEFFDKSNYTQLKILESKKIETSQQTELFGQDIIPANTEFKEYILIGPSSKRFISRYITELEKLDGNWIETEVPVYDFTTYNRYTVKGFDFQYADFVFSESYYKI